jgi:hypothetical protein
MCDAISCQHGREPTGHGQRHALVGRIRIRHTVVGTTMRYILAFECNAEVCVVVNEKKDKHAFYLFPFREGGGQALAGLPRRTCQHS